MAVSRPAPQLVGRRPQMQWLNRCLDEALAGQPRVAVLRGETGIGKSRLAHELGELAAGRGVPVFYARCHERLSLPYLPLETSLFPRLRAFVAQAGGAPSAAAERRRGGLLRVLGAPSAGPPAAGEAVEVPEAARLERARLLFDLASLTLRLAESESLLLIVDDLHWADEATFDFLMHLGRCLADAQLRGDALPLLLAMTARPELEARRAADLERLQREEICSSFELEGLDRFEAAELLRQLGFERASGEAVDTLERATGGNPLFLEAAARGTLAREGASDRAGASEAPFPSEISDAIAARLAQLSPRCRELLTVASFFGAGCSLESLRHAAAASEEELAGASAEAQRQGIVELDGESLAFAHPLYREHLYAATGSRRRERVHARIAATLREHYWSDLDAHVPELADHLMAAGSAADPGDAFAFASAAGRRASGVFAWSRAVRCYRAALDAAERSSPSPGDAELAQLARAAALACELAMDSDGAFAFLDAARERYERLGDASALVEVQASRVLYVVRLGYRGAASAPSRDAVREVAELERLIERFGPERQGLRAAALADLAILHFARGRFDEARAVAQRAAAVDRSRDAPAGQVRGGIALALVEMLQLDLVASLGHLDDAVAAARAADDPVLLCQASNRRPLVLFHLGRLREAETAARGALELGRAINDPVHNVLPLSALVAASVVRGRYDDADRHAYEAILVEHLSGYTWASALLHCALASIRLHRGEWAEAERALEAWEDDCAEEARAFVAPVTWLFRQLVCAHAGELERARSALRAHPRRLVAPAAPRLGISSWCSAVIELAALLDEPALAKEPARVLAAAEDRGQVFSESLIYHVPRMLGVAARLQGDHAAAVRLLERAVSETADLDARAEHALALLDLALALVAQGGDRERALALAVQAREHFTELGMPPGAARAERLAAELGGPGAWGESDPAALWERVDPARAPRGAPSRTVSLMFSDMVRSTEMVERLGDLRARQVVREHNRIVREQMAAMGGTEAELRGDGFLLTFPSARSALLCAIGIQHAFADYSRAHPEQPIRVRIGLHTGEVVEDGQSLFGLSVILAARIAAEAREGEILVSSLVRDLTGSAGDIRFGAPRDLRLKGFAEAQRVFEVEWL